MKTLTSVLLSSLLLVSTVACNNVPASQITADAEVRRKQLNADIRAREQRIKARGRDAERSDDDIKSQARRKLEANLPASQITVDAKDGNVSIAGTVPSQPQYQRIEPLAKEIYGVKNVAVKVTVVPVKPKS